MLSPPDSPRGKLLQQYVLARITRMDDVDVGLFDRDWNNTIYFFALNADEQIYLRYGGRDSESPDTFLNLASLELALAKGLELHQQYREGKLARAERPKPVFPREFPLLVERTFARNACVECHLIGDFMNQHRELDGTLDKLTHMFRSPDPRTLGIYIDLPKGLLVKESRGAAQSAGIAAGDRIASVNGTPVWTFGDLQYRLDQTPRRSESLQIGLERQGQAKEVTLGLPVRWWYTDLRFRQMTIDPRVYFDSRPLSAEQKRARGLDPDGFASEVTHTDAFAEMMKSHALKTGDIIFGVDGAYTDPDANTAELYIKLRKKAGDSVTLEVLRGGRKMKMPLRTYRMAFRK